MQIVNFQCGKCGKLMGVSAEHLGVQVHCPHCREIVEAPKPADDSDSSEVRVQLPDIKEQESIFTHPEDEQGDDLFGGPTRPLVELPPESAPRHAESAPSQQTESGPAWSAESGAAAAATVAASPEDPVAELPAPVVSRPAKASMLGPMLLVLLIPYSLVTTAYIIWTMLHPPIDPLIRIPDRGRNGGPKRVDPDTPLPGRLKTSLQEPIRVGAVEVTPVKVALNRDGDLVLLLKLANLSTDQAFSPIDHDFMRYAEGNPRVPRPYTYLDAGALGKLQGGYLRFLRRPDNREDDPKGGVIRPGQEVFAELITLDKYRDTRLKSILQSQRPLVWRVHIRRGLVQVGGRDVSATAVIGVEFLPSAVEKSSA